jgi:hypothetical protein
LTDETLRQLRRQPVLLREVAAELAKQEPRVAAAAIETLGIEVSSDLQAQAFGKAAASLSDSFLFADDRQWTSGLEDIKLSNFDPVVVRTWATEDLTRADTRRLVRALNGIDAGDNILTDFRDYFRAGVSSSLSVGKLGSD